jgi:ABC-type Fe3+-hydroxamate transport system substrate-binding protein
MTTAPCRQYTGPCLAVDSTVSAVSLQHPARRIVCLCTSGLDVVRELGLEPVGSLRGGVRAHPEFYTPGRHQWEDVGPWLGLNFKKIRRLQPDLILG